MGYFKKYNNLFGWVVALISGVVYVMTTEPSASLWDCAEFIATSYKLEIGHPPGNPLFFLIARLFAIFAPSTQYVALAINIMSCVCSALTIMFLFWSITHLARKIEVGAGSEPTKNQSWAIIAAGVVGSLAYAFTDTFWFSAVESEVYAMSSLFTAMVFWAILKWEEYADEKHSGRWLVLIAYLMGLSVGVHLLNLLAIPTIVFVYYFKKYEKITRRGVILATVASVLLLGLVNFFVIPGTVAMGAAFDYAFVNWFGMEFNTGLIVFALLLFALLGGGLWFTYNKGMVKANAALLFIAVFMIGYGSYTSYPIRAVANPPMNSNNPNNAYALKSTLDRDQYGSRPLLFGPYYNSEYNGVKEGDFYIALGDRYEKFSRIIDYTYPSELKTFFPRMYSPAHAEGYKAWGGVRGVKRNYINYRGEPATVTLPTFAENLKFFFNYQLNFMYWRYFMWNFVGRQSDEQSVGELTKGNWLSGITPIDEMLLGPQSNLPDDMKNNKGRNVYFFLPFLLGLLGVYYQYIRDGRGFTVVMWLFIMTGLAIAVYLNMPPGEPRERDYVFAGSFYAFSIWIGLGLLLIHDSLKKFTSNRWATLGVATVLSAIVPVILIAENWDDHDRSHRYVARDFGHNYLESTLPNSIIMNFGDNDTFPLWYSQEVEGVRPDVRVMNMSYLGAEWYIDQMKIKSNESEPVPFSLPREKYTGVNGSLPVYETFDRPLEIAQVMELIKSDDPRTKVKMYSGRQMDYIPVTTILLPVNKQNAIESGILRAEDAHLAVDTIVLKLSGSQIDRSEMMLLDLLANFDWKRPLYFTQPTAVTRQLGLTEFMQQDGFAYRLVPIRTEVKGLTVGRIDTEYLWNNLMNKFKYANIKDPRAYADATIQHSYRVVQLRGTFARLAQQLMEEGDTVRAKQALAFGLEEVPFSKIAHSYDSTLPVIETYYKMNQPEKANEVLNEWAYILKQHMFYYSQFSGAKWKNIEREFDEDVYMLYELYKLATKYKQTAIMEEMETYFKQCGLMEE